MNEKTVVQHLLFIAKSLASLKLCIHHYASKQTFVSAQSATRKQLLGLKQYELAKYKFFSIYKIMYPNIEVLFWEVDLYFKAWWELPKLQPHKILPKLLQ